MYFVLHFNLPVSTNEGTLQIKNAVERGTIGSYLVKNFKTIEEFEVDPTTSPSVGSIATHSSIASISPGERVNKDTAGKYGGPYRTSTIFFFRLKFLSHLFVTKLVLCNDLILQLRFLR